MSPQRQSLAYATARPLRETKHGQYTCQRCGIVRSTHRAKVGICADCMLVTQPSLSQQIRDLLETYTREQVEDLLGVTRAQIKAAIGSVRHD